MKVKHVTFFVTVADMKTLLQTLNETLICGYCYVISPVSAAPKKLKLLGCVGLGVLVAPGACGNFK